MWDLPGPGLEPVSTALASGFLTTAPPGKPEHITFSGKNKCVSLNPLEFAWTGSLLWPRRRQALGADARVFCSRNFSSPGLPSTFTRWFQACRAHKESLAHTWALSEVMYEVSLNLIYEFMAVSWGIPPDGPRSYVGTVLPDLTAKSHVNAACGSSTVQWEKWHRRVSRGILQCDHQPNKIGRASCRERV